MFTYLLLYLPYKENNIIGVLKVVTSGNKRTRFFSEKDVFCKISGGSGILLAKYASNFIRIEPCYRLLPRTAKQFFNKTIALKSDCIRYQEPISIGFLKPQYFLVVTLHMYGQPSP